MKMQKILLGILAMAFIISSCKKSSSLSPNNWSFKGTTYNATTVTESSSTYGTYNLTPTNTTYSATNISNSNISTYTTMLATFIVTPSAGTYTVVNSFPYDTTQVQITYTINGTTPVNYNSTGGNGSNQKVAVTVSAAGKVTIKGSGIELINTSTATDSSALSLNITQTN